MTLPQSTKESVINAIDEAQLILREKGMYLWKELCITRGAVWQWKLEGREVPAKHCKKIEVLTDHRVTCGRLNPKVFGTAVSEQKQ